MNLPRNAFCAVVFCVALLAAPAESQEVSAAATQSPQLRALLVVRDSVTRVRTEIARFSRDLPLAGSQTVMNRARRLTAACTGLRAAFGGAVPDLRARSGAPASVRQTGEAVRAEARRASATLNAECVQGLRPEGPGTWPDSLKAWGPHRTSNIEQSLVAYERAAAAFAKASDIEFPPKAQ